MTNGAFCNNFDLHSTKAIISLDKPIFGLFESGRFTQVLLKLCLSDLSDQILPAVF